MSDWRDFLDDLAQPAGTSPAKPKPGPVMICFVNRYLQALDGIHYKIKHGNQLLEGRTSEGRYCITIQPYDLNPVQVYAWSRERNAFKRLDDVRPAEGRKRLVRKIMRTYKVDGKTEPHPRGTPIAPPPAQPKPAPAPAPSPATDQGVKPLPAKDESGLPITDVERPVPDKITKEQLKKIFVAASDSYLTQVADELNTDLPKYGLDTALRRAHFFAQIREEAGPRLTANEENLNYPPELLMKFKYYKKHPAEAQQDGRLDDPKAKGKKAKPLQAANKMVIANKVYANRGGNGDVSSGDGWKYRGRGFIQLTFKKGYEKFYKEYKKYWTDTAPDFLLEPEKVKDFPYNIRSAVWFWIVNGLPSLADKGSGPEVADKITAVINLYTDSYAHRRTNFVVAYSAFK